MWVGEEHTTRATLSVSVDVGRRRACCMWVGEEHAARATLSVPVDVGRRRTRCPRYTLRPVTRHRQLELTHATNIVAAYSKVGRIYCLSSTRHHRYPPRLAPIRETATHTSRVRFLTSNKNLCENSHEWCEQREEYGKEFCFRPACPWKEYYWEHILTLLGFDPMITARCLIL
ncbi:hypothetical protein FB451DRAFT_1185300 [Mycena latifolia]|nr:hypothetical protein FB451DRAFT_1185300 [Mycena latifolia]